MKFKLSLVAMVIGIFLMPMVASAALDDYSFNLNINNQNSDIYKAGYTGPFIRVDVTYDDNNTNIATLKFTRLNGYTFNDIGLNLNSGVTVTDPSKKYTFEYNANQQIDGFGRFNTYGTQIADSGYSSSLQSLVLNVSGLNGNSVFDSSFVNPVAAHIFASDGKSGKATGHAPVPIPAAAWLLGSGLLGLVGIRRKKSA